MAFDYIIDPQQIEDKSFEMIREVTNLSGLDDVQKQVVMRVVHSTGMPELAANMRFSSNACESGLAALQAHAPILCDVEMVKQGITKRMIEQEPLCFLNHPNVAQIAANNGETRSMAALQLWQEQLAGSIVMIGNAPTALYRLLEMLEQGCAKPALIIAIPVGFVGAAESKQAMWDLHEALTVECITLLGRQGGSAATASVLNALLRVNK